VFFGLLCNFWFLLCWWIFITELGRIIMKMCEKMYYSCQKASIFFWNLWKFFKNSLKSTQKMIKREPDLTFDMQ
jgi:hypothetical protein